MIFLLYLSNSVSGTESWRADVRHMQTSSVRAADYDDELLMKTFVRSDSEDQRDQESERDVRENYWKFFLVFCHVLNWSLCQWENEAKDNYLFL